MIDLLYIRNNKASVNLKEGVDSLKNSKVTGQQLFYETMLKKLKEAQEKVAQHR